jgi:hypothetical protein
MAGLFDFLRANTNFDTSQLQASPLLAGLQAQGMGATGGAPPPPTAPPQAPPQPPPPDPNAPINPQQLSLGGAAYDQPSGEDVAATNQAGLLANPQPGIRGFLGRLATPGADGLTMQDKLLAASQMLQGNNKGALDYLDKRRTAVAKAKTDADTQAQQDSLRQQLQASIGPNGVDTMGFVKGALAGGAKPGDIINVAKEFAQKGAVQGGWTTSTDPITGKVTFGQQAPKTYGDVDREAAQKETARHNLVDEGTAAQRAGYEGQRVGLEGQTVQQGAQKVGLDTQGLTLRKLQFAHAQNPTAPILGSQADYDRLPSGRKTTYIAPDGTVHVKP